MAAPWQWENATAGAVAGFATVAAMHPLDVVRTRFQGLIFHSWNWLKTRFLTHQFVYSCLLHLIETVNDGRGSSLPTYKNTAHAVFTIARLEVSQKKLSLPFFYLLVSFFLASSIYSSLCNVVRLISVHLLVSLFEDFWLMGFVSYHLFFSSLL